VSSPQPQREPATRLHWPCLLTALAIMLAGTAYPPLFADGRGGADHGLAMLLFWAMSAGFVAGLGFVPRAPAWRWLFSPASCAAGVAGAVLLVLLR
jgi:predicted membrane protein